MDIIERLIDLRKQATTEKSHYYVAKTCELAIFEIKKLRGRLEKQCPECQQNEDSGMNFCAFCGRRLWSN